MRKIISPIFVLLIIVGSSCQEKIDIEKEKDAIKAVIEEYSDAIVNRDFDRWAASYVQDETYRKLVVAKYGYSYKIGWEEISSIQKEYFKNNPEPSTVKRQFTNYKIKLYKESAWAVCDVIVHRGGEFSHNNIKVIFLEKVDGEWKFAFQSRVNITSYEEEPEEEESETEE